MARTRFKWKCVFVTYFVIVNVFTKSLPINTNLPLVTTIDSTVDDAASPIVPEDVAEPVEANNETVDNKSVNEIDVEMAVNDTRAGLLRNIRNGQKVEQYAVELTVNGNSFRGRVVLDVEVDQATRGDTIILHCQNLVILSVKVGVFSAANVVTTRFTRVADTIRIFPRTESSYYAIIIEYTGQIANDGRGLYVGSYNDETYLAMNLHPTHARRVFPCMDEPTQTSRIRFTLNNEEYTHLVANSMLEENSPNQFRALEGPPHLWGMVAHNFVNINLPVNNVLLFGRQGVTNQEAQASVAINSYFNFINDWTDKSYFEITSNQDGRMNILALPDVSRDWHSLSTVGIWEPHIYMESVHSVRQRSIALPKIAEAMAKQWFGYVIYPENWRFEWVVSGLATYAGYEMFKHFQDNPLGNDVTMLDVNALFVSEVIQESLLRDSYVGAQVLEPSKDIFDEDEIRSHVHGLQKLKAPALMRMFRVVLGDEEQDFVQSAARALLNGRPLQTVNSLSFVDAINSNWLSSGNELVGDIAEFMEPWIWNSGYPLLTVGTRQGGVLVTQERFGFATQTPLNYEIPITFTTSINPDFDDIHPKLNMVAGSLAINTDIDDDTWVIMNLQGQGYYRVNYDAALWERLIEALGDPERRQEIHSLNRATLLDDALNLARGGRLGYDVALSLVLTMEHETDYAPWRAFLRNMEYLQKWLLTHITEEDDLDPDIYLRMVRRTIGAIENELSFEPALNQAEPVMHTLTRGLVMEHACRADYQPCVAAAVDMFYNADEVVNPNIPHDLRPAVYCTMVKEGDDTVIAALYDRLEIEASHYERVVILESLACSQDEVFINTLLEETVAANSPYGVEERVKIFNAVARSSNQNIDIAIRFISRRIHEIRDMYGGDEKIEEIIFVLAENIAHPGLATDFAIWVRAQENGLNGVQDAAIRAVTIVNANLAWADAHLVDIYEWIDENHAPTYIVSMFALCLSILVALLNH